MTSTRRTFLSSLLAGALLGLARPMGMPLLRRLEPEWVTVLVTEVFVPFITDRRQLSGAITELFPETRKVGGKFIVQRVRDGRRDPNARLDPCYLPPAPEEPEP